MMAIFAKLSALLCLLLVPLALAACAARSATPQPVAYTNPQIEVVIDGLLAPIGMALMPDGGLLVAEDGTGNNDDSAGVSLITPDGQVGRLISGFKSTRDSGDLAGSPLVALSPDGATLYVGAYEQQQLWTLPLSPAQQTGLSLPAQPYTTADLTPTMQPLNRVMVMNPFDMAFDPAGVPVVTDSTGDGVAKENPDGTTRFIHRFARIPDPRYPDKKTVSLSPVPTGIARISDEYWVTLTGGCPFPPGAGRLVAIDEERNERLVRDGLNMPIDVAQGPDGTIWLLEFATFAPDGSCFTNEGYQANTGRLSRLLPDGALAPVLENLNFPGAVLPLADGSLYLTEVYPGRVLHVRFGDQAAASDGAPPTGSEPPPVAKRVPVSDYDSALSAVIAGRGLQPRPGAGEREGDTPLARLGQALFFDPILSGDANLSCATCHHPLLAGGDGRVLPIGTGGEGLGPARDFVEQIVLAAETSGPRRLAGWIDPDTGLTTAQNPFAGQFVPRNSQTILNAALYPRQFWDGRVELRADGRVRTLESQVNALGLTDPLVAQALFPLTSVHEMAGASLGDLAPQTIRTALLARLRQSPDYVQLFQTAFGGEGEDAINAVNLAKAIAAFERRWIFTDAPWDRYLAGDEEALSEQQKRGALLFFGQIDGGIDCAQCHAGDLFSDFEFHNILAPQLGPGKGQGYSGREDWGRAGATFDLRQQYAFRTPPLRNVELTAPYFHDGAYPSLETAIRHHADPAASAATYDPIANAIPPALFSSLRPYLPEKQLRTVAPALATGLPLSAEDIADLVAFLTALTDPAARDLSAFLVSSVPSGLPLDPLPTQAGATPAPPVSAGSPSPTFAATTETERGDLQFRDIAAQAGLDFQHGAFQTALFEDPAAAMGGGLCWLDYDNDGWLDLYLINSHATEEIAYLQAQGGLPTNALYRNEGGTFREVTAASGAGLALRGNGCLAADFDNDGWTDIYITADGPNALLWNRGDGTFSEGAADAGVAAPEWNSAAVAGDLNGDGLLDLFVAAYIDLNHRVPKPAGLFPQDYYGLPDHLYLNRGIDPASGRALFEDVSQAAGLVRQERGLGALFGDFDDDGDLDLYIANDGHPNRMYANEPWPGGVAADPLGLGFRLRDLTATAQVGDSGSGMGVAGGDYDGDGQLDLVVTNWEHELNALYRNRSAEEGHAVFEYSTFRMGMAGFGNSQTGWGVNWGDFDHDTDLDLVVANGKVPITNMATDRQTVRFYRNRGWDESGQVGAPGQFLDFSQQVGLRELGPIMGRGSAVADFDNDGDLDVAINTIGGPVVLLENGGASGRWLQVDLGGMRPGARAWLELPDGRVLLREVHAGSSYLATEDPRLHFGLGLHDHATRLTIRWPDGSEETHADVRAGARLALTPP